MNQPYADKTSGAPYLTLAATSTVTIEASAAAQAVAALPKERALHKDAGTAKARQDVSVAVLGGGRLAAALVRGLARLEDVRVVSVWCPRRDLPAAEAALAVGADVRTDVSDAARSPQARVVIDASGDERMAAAVSALLPGTVELLRGSSVTLLARLLAAGAMGERKALRDLRMAVDRVRGQERRLSASNESLERAYELIERELAEMYFMHEFSTQLTAYTSADGVSSLLVDGANGMFGATLSALYLVDRADWMLRLRACQGAPQEAFRSPVAVSETVLGQAFSDGRVQETDLSTQAASASWFRPGGLKWQAAVALRAGDDVIAVLVIGSLEERSLDAGELTRLQSMADLSALALQNAILHGELERLSATDRLTGLHNHGHFQQRLEDEVSRATRYGHALALILLDIDDFKSFNDTYGHIRGDSVLRDVSAVIRANLREEDIAARYGGEEFVVVLPETDVEGATRVAERIREQIAALEFDAGGGVTASRTVSVGVAAFPRPVVSPEDLVEQADRAMYMAKRGGKNRVEAAPAAN